MKHVNPPKWGVDFLSKVQPSFSGVEKKISPFCSYSVIFVILIRIYRMGEFVHARERAREGFAVAKENHHSRSSSFHSRSISASRFCCPSVR